MIPKLRWLAPFLALAAITVAGTANAAAAPTVRLDGVRTTLWTDAATTRVLLANKIVPLPARGTGVDVRWTAAGPSIGYRFPIAGGHVDSNPQDLPQSGITRTLLSPVEVSSGGVDGHSHTPSGLVAAIVVSLPGLHERLDIRAVQVAAHDPHAFAIAPVQFPAHRLEMQLLRGERNATGNDGRPIASIEVRAFDRTVVDRRISHVRPVDVPGLDVDRDAIGEPASGDDDPLVGAVGTHGEQATGTADLEHEQHFLWLSHSNSFSALSRRRWMSPHAG